MSRSDLLRLRRHDAMFGATNGLSSYVLQVQRAVSEALLACHGGASGSEASLKLRLRRFPEVRGEGQKGGGAAESLDVSALGGIFYFCGFTTVFVLALRQASGAARALFAFAGPAMARGQNLELGLGFGLSRGAALPCHGADSGAGLAARE